MKDNIRNDLQEGMGRGIILVEHRKPLAIKVSHSPISFVAEHVLHKVMDNIHYGGQPNNHMDYQCVAPIPSKIDL